MTNSKDKQQENSQWDIIKRLFIFSWPRLSNTHKVRLGGASLFLVFAQLASLSIPYLLGQLVDVASKAVGDVYALMLGLVIAYASVRLIQVVFTETKDLLFIHIVQHAIRELARNLFSKLHSLPLEFHLNRLTGGLSMAIERGTKSIEYIFSYMIFGFIPIFFELGLICIIFWGLYGFSYSIITFITIILYTIFTTVVSEWRIKFRRRMNENNEASNTIAIDSLINHETVKIFSAEKNEVNRYDYALANYQDATIVSQKTLSMLNVGQTIIITAGLASILFLAVNDTSNNLLSAGDIATLNAYILQMFLPLGFLGTVYRLVSQAIVDIEKVFNILDTQSTVKDIDDAPDLPHGSGEIEFKNISINYADRKILSDINFTIPANQRFAIVGETGSGKTTITRLLSRLIDPKEGTIYIDGNDIGKFNQLSVRKQMAFVPQDIVLFNSSLKVNLLLGKPDASDDDIAKVLDISGLTEFVKKLPEGLATIVGERGLKLSGGERQRFAIARALLKDPRIIVLDEATSALDVPTEKKVKDAMARATQGRTTLVIAHRLATVVDCNKILVLDQGKVVEEGTHTELLELGKIYAAAWKLQSQKKQ